MDTIGDKMNENTLNKKDGYKPIAISIPTTAYIDIVDAEKQESVCISSLRVML